MAYTQFPASEKQLSFLATLFNERVHTYNADFVLRSGLTKRQASVLIGTLLKAKKKSVAAVSFATTSPAEDPRIVRARERAAALIGVSKGFYAIPDVAGTLKFYEVRKPYRREGLELKGLRGAPGAFLRTWVQHEEALEVLRQIRIDPYEPMMLFAETYSVCGRCAAPLTDEQSRERKLGPVCWDMLKQAGHLPAGIA